MAGNLNFRVFVSSTFRDMHAEREVLAKRVFPRLRKICDQRGIAWGDVDLRWGVTDEQKAEGLALPLCLDEIDRCTCFIGILGERYGWVPETIPQDFTRNRPWLVSKPDCSITEYEILHALAQPRLSGNLLFYFRSIADPPAEQHEPQESSPKLAELKAHIASVVRTHRDYSDPLAFGNQVLDDVIALIDKLVPEGKTAEPLDRELIDHAAFAESRTHIHITHQGHMKTLDEHARSNGPPLVLIGESGVGKSALLANWAVRHRAQNPKDHLVMHFVGASQYSAEWDAMLRRLISELSRQLDIEVKIPDGLDELRSAFARTLSMAAMKGRVILIIDALNQLTDLDGAPDLVWLPKSIPANVRLFVSTLPGRSLDELKLRSWPTFQINPLTEEERHDLIVRYLEYHGKHLSPDKTDLITRHPSTGNPLFLRTLLDELRLHGDHQTLERQIQHYLSAPTIAALYDLILTRYERDYETERPKLVTDAMKVLWAARRGVTESELLDLLGEANHPLPHTYWSPLFFAADAGLIDRGGLLGFANSYLRQAVERRYLSEPQVKQSAHRRLSDYFSSQAISPRQVDELPWQLTEISDWTSLSKLLADMSFLRAASKANRYEVRRYWSILEKEARLDIATAYRHVLDHPQLYDYDRLDTFADLLMAAGRFDQARPIVDYQIKLAKEAKNPKALAASISFRATLAKYAGNVEESWEYYRQAEELYHQLDDELGIATILYEQSLLFLRDGNHDEALRTLDRVEELNRKLKDPVLLVGTLGHRSKIYAELGQLDRALELRHQQEEICRRIGDPELLASSLLRQAVFEWDKGLNQTPSLENAEQSEEIPESIIAGLVKAGNLLDEAAALAEDYLSVAIGTWIEGYRDFLRSNIGRRHRTLIFRAVEKFRLDQLVEAEAMLKRAEAIARALRDDEAVAISLDEQGIIMLRRKDFIGALKLMRQEEEIYRKTKNDAGLQACLGSQATVLIEQNDFKGALRLLDQQQEICRRIDHKAGLAFYFGNKARILWHEGQIRESLQLMKEEEGLARTVGDQERLAQSLISQALILADDVQMPQEALQAAQEAFNICATNGWTALGAQIEPVLKRLSLHHRPGLGRKLLNILGVKK